MSEQKIDLRGASVSVGELANHDFTITFTKDGNSLILKFDDHGINHLVDVIESEL